MASYRKTFSSSGTKSNSLHNGVFNTDGSIPLSVGNIVKLKGRDTNTIEPFTPDTTVSSIVFHKKSNIIDLIATDNEIYILGTTSNTYFIRREYFNCTDSTTLNLGTFQEPLSLQGNICIRNGQIVVLIYHIGQAVITGNRHVSSRTKGILFNININDYKVTSFRNIPLSQNFFLFGGLEETGREEPLYLLNDNILYRFNPAGSPSWSHSIGSDIVSATTSKDLILLLHSDSLEALDPNTGKSLWMIPITPGAKCSVGISNQIYIAIVVNNYITIMRGDVDVTGFKLTSSYNYTTTAIPEVCGITTLGVYKYIVWSDREIRILTNENMLVSTTTIQGLTIEKTYRILPRHLTNEIYAVVNGQHIIYINDIPTFTNKELDSSMSGTFRLKEDFPRMAGILTDILDENHVYVVLSGSVIDIIPNLKSNTIYIVDKFGNLTGTYHNMNEIMQDNNRIQGRPFLITGIDPNQATIIYNKLS